jgi:hypothetical protein
MNEQSSPSPRRRLQELLAIPERERTDAQWDEINELEITLASANRADNQQDVRRNAPPANDQPRSGGGGGGGGQGKKPFKKFHKKPPKGPAA